jgi:hypothetical protein
LHGHLLDESLRLTVQVSHLKRRGRGHGPGQRRSRDELLARARWCVWIIYIEVGVDVLVGLLA